MCSSPGYSKPTHEYGQPFGDQAEVLDGTAETATWAMEDDWAGRAFPLPYQESE